MAAMTMPVSASISQNVRRQPNESATQVPSGTPATEAIEKPENTHAMNFVRCSGLATSSAYVMESERIVPDAAAMMTRPTHNAA